MDTPSTSFLDESCSDDLRHVLIQVRHIVASQPQCFVLRGLHRNGFPQREHTLLWQVHHITSAIFCDAYCTAKSLFWDCFKALTELRFRITYSGLTRDLCPLPCFSNYYTLNLKPLTHVIAFAVTIENSSGELFSVILETKNVTSMHINLTDTKAVTTILQTVRK